MPRNLAVFMDKNIGQVTKGMFKKGLLPK